MRPTLQKYLSQRYPPIGSKKQVPMPTAAMTGGSFPLPSATPTNATPGAQTQPRHAPLVINNFVMPWRTVFFAILVFSGAALTIRAILDGEIRLWRGQTNVAQIVVERIITATPQPTAQPPTTPAPVIVTATPPQPVYVERVAPPQPAQRSNRHPLSPPVQSQPTAWPAPSTGGYLCQQCAGRGCDGFSPDKPIYLDPFAQVEGATIRYWTPHLTDMSNTTTLTGCRAR